MATTTYEFTRGIDYSAIVATSERVALWISFAQSGGTGQIL
jgi:hypothetical protein